MERKAFLDQEPPPGYLAGVGRGATGFTTGADTGPVKFESQFGGEVNDGPDGQELGILAQTSTGSKDDEEADKIYEEIDRRLQARHKKKPQVRALEDVEIPTGTGAIKQRFTLLKNELAEVSIDEWANLPEVGDLTRKNKRQRLLDQQNQRTYAAPDMLISGAGSGLRDHGETSHKSAENLDSAARLAEIEEWEQKSAMAGDLEKGRLILASLRKAEPYKADLWISSARLEEQARQIPQARALISKGCDLIPHNDEIWLESIRLHRSEGTKVCKAIMSEALRLNSQSERLWFSALDLENPQDTVSRKKIVMKALEFLPSNVSLWKALIDMDSSSEEKIRLLTRATQLCPLEWDLWLTLVNLSSYIDAKAVLNKARKQLPTEANVWITALKLEERENSDVSVDKLANMFSKGRKELAKHHFVKSPVQWIDDAIRSQNEHFAKTAQAIVKSALKDIEGDESLDQLRELAELHTSSSETIASYIYQFIAESYPQIVGHWIKLFALLKKDLPRLYMLYQQAISHLPENDILPLMYAKDKWLLSSDVPAARSILENAGTSMPHSEKIWVARFKLEVRNQEFARALAISEEALSLLLEQSPRVWYKHIHILRYYYKQSSGLSFMNRALETSKKALDTFADNPKLFLQRSQILIDSGDKTAARECLSVATKMCPHTANVWVSLANLDLEISAGARARSVLDTAVTRFPDDPLLWEAKIQLEFKLKDFVTARQLINKTLKRFPSSPRIWILHLKNIPKMSHRKNAFLDALKQTDNSTDILLAIGVFFWIDGKHAKAKAWFDRALSSNNKNGDAWGWLYCFQSRYGKSEDFKQLMDDYLKHFDDIRIGDVWSHVVKNPLNLDKSPADLLKLVSDQLTLTEV